MLRVEAAAVVAVHDHAAQLHALLAAQGLVLRPLARGHFVQPGELRVSLVWRDRRHDVSHVANVTLRACDLV